MTLEKCIVIGAGPAGYTAAIYAARAQLNPIVFTGLVPGGQLTTTTEIENFPGFPEGIDGTQLMENMAQQAKRFAARLVNETVTEVKLNDQEKVIKTDKNEYRTQTVIIATGAKANLLGLPNEERLIGKGVSTCATCDGFFYRGKEVAIVGGGDSALEEANFLTKFATKVTVIHRRDQFRASKIMQQRAFDNEKIEILWETIPLEMIGEENLRAIKLKNVKSGEESEFKVDGVFIAIGHKPQTEIFKGQLGLDEQGYLISKDGGKTEINGVFAAGDVHDSKYRQAITAAGWGCAAAISAEHYLQDLS